MALDSTKVFAAHLAKCKIVNTIVNNCTATASGIVKLIDDLQTTYEGKRVAISENYVLGVRERESENISGAAGMLQASWLDLMEVIDRADNSSEDLRYRECYNYMDTSSIYFVSRGMTVSTPTLTTGTMKIVTVDAENYPIEYASPGTFSMTCESQINLSDRPGREKWRVIPQDSGVDWIDFFDNPRMEQGFVYTWDSEKNSMLVNPSFGNYADAGTGTSATIGTANSDITDWTMIGTITNLVVQRDTYYNIDAVSGSDYDYGNALAVVSTMTTGTVGMEQKILNKMSTDYPYYAAVRFYRPSTAAIGTLALSVGSASATVAMTDYAITTWHTLEIPLTSACWYKNFTPTTNTYIDFKWAFAAATSNAASVYIDACEFHAFDRFGNLFLSMEQGTSNFTLNDTCAYTVAYGTTGLRQRMEAVLNNRYYPTNSVATDCLADT